MKPARTACSKSVLTDIHGLRGRQNSTCADMREARPRNVQSASRVRPGLTLKRQRGAHEVGESDGTIQFYPARRGAEGFADAGPG